MSIKRRDNRGRILNTGESQRRDGRYAYKHINKLGKAHFIYAWRLTEADSTPKGKRHDKSLREKIKELEKNKLLGIEINGKDMTVFELLRHNFEMKKNIRPSTKNTYKKFLSLIERDSFGKRLITDIKVSDAKQWLISCKEKGLSYSTIKFYRSLLKDAFKTAVQDGLIPKNAFDFKLTSIIKNDTKQRYALTDDEVNRLLNFLKEDTVYRKHYDEVVVLLGTGLRVSELSGLTLSDVDLDNRKIYVRRQLLKLPKKGYVIQEPKTESGKREIPMSKDVYNAFLNVLRNRTKQSVTIEGLEFIFLTNKGLPKVAIDYQHMLYRVVNKYNNTNKQELPNITPHILRHSFCTTLAHKGISPQNLSQIMGHSSVIISFDYYTHTNFEILQQEMNRLLD